MRKSIAAILFILGLIYWLKPGQSGPRPGPRPDRDQFAMTAHEARVESDSQPKVRRPVPKVARLEAIPPNTPHPSEIVSSRDDKKDKLVLPYKMHGPLIVVQGDLVVGTPTRPDAPETGFVNIPPLKLWKKNSSIPYWIQPSVTNPERVLQALAMFEGTAVRFTQFTNEEDVLVFEVGNKDCLSYVGQVGGKQPIYISPECQPADIAHEVLHALGFVHEQNRSDRDAYVKVHPENIDERYAENFEKLPEAFMKVSGLGEFDFQSVMLYPAWMFARNGQSTMEPKIPDQLIAPLPRLSPGDENRVNKAYGSR